jgi:DNA-binding transcriptional regulator YiaG
MKNAKLKEQITSIIALHYDRELWHSRPEQSYEGAIEPFVNDLIRIATYHKRGWKFRSYKYDEHDLLVLTTTGEHIGDRIRELRLRKGWSLAQFARKTEIDAEYLQSVERGEPILRMWALKTILDILKVKSSAVLPF